MRRNGLTKLPNPFFQLFFILIFVFTQVAKADDRPGAANAAQNGAQNLANRASEDAADHQKKSEDAASKGDSGTSMKELAMMAMAAAQMAAALAAMAQNKKAKEAAKAADPVQTPAMPNMPEPAKPQESPMMALPGSSPSPDVTPDPVAPSSLTSGPQVDIPADDTPAVTTADGGPAPGPVVSESKVPNSIDRTKLGYDETTTKSGDSQSNGAGTPNYNPSSAPTRGASASNDLTGKSGALAAELAGVENRWAKNKTAPDGDGAAAGGDGDHGPAGGADAPGSGGSGDMMSMLNSIMGKGEGDGGGSHQQGITLDGYSTAKGKPVGIQKENIFQHASYRFRKLAFEDDGVRPDARKSAVTSGDKRVQQNAKSASRVVSAEMSP